MISNKIPFRRGSTFSYTGVLALPDNVTWSIKSYVMTKEDRLIQNLTSTIQKLSTPTANHETHSVLIEATATQTALWPIDTLLGYVDFNDNSPTPRVLRAGSFQIGVNQ